MHRARALHRFDHAQVGEAAAAEGVVCELAHRERCAVDPGSDFLAQVEYGISCGGADRVVMVASPVAVDAAPSKTSAASTV